MKHFTVCLVIAALLAVHLPLDAGELATSEFENKEKSGVASTLNQFLIALRNGSIGEISRQLSHELRRKKKTLLERNEEYSSFLRKYYAGSKFEGIQFFPVDKGVIVDIAIRLKSGNRDNLRMLMQKNARGQWTVAEEVTGSYTDYIE